MEIVYQSEVDHVHETNGFFIFYIWMANATWFSFDKRLYSLLSRSFYLLILPFLFNSFYAADTCIGALYIISLFYLKMHSILSWIFMNLVSIEIFTWIELKVFSATRFKCDFIIIRLILWEKLISIDSILFYWYK